MDGLRIVPGESGYMNLTAAERDTIQHVERFGASISLVGVVFIFIAYFFFKRVRTIPNTFIFFASVANVGASIACLIGYAGILAGDSSALCQAQAFLLEMFMQSDPWWSFAMAVNVYMVFFMAYHPNYNHMWLYCLLCFGLPALPALICLVYAPNGERIYGNATLWCWIGDNYNQLRIFTYYLPIWMCTVLSAVIYVAVGYHVFHQRNQLRNLTLSNQAKDTSGIELEGSSEKGRQASYGTVTTVVQVTAEPSSRHSQVTLPLTPAASITPVLPKIQSTPRLHPWASHDEDNDEDDDEEEVDDLEQRRSSPAARASPAANNNSSNNHHHRTPHPNPFTTTTITTANNTNPNNQPRKSARPFRSSRSRSNRSSNSNSSNKVALWSRFTAKLASLDPVKLAYLRTSFVFAISVLVTWTPSSINRVYALAYPARTSYALNLAGAVVLPLQGVWNAVIFAATSWGVLREEVAGLLRRKRGRPLLMFLGSTGVRCGAGSVLRLGEGAGYGEAGGDGGYVRGPGGSGLVDAQELVRVGTHPRSAHRAVGNVRVFRGGSL
ncbi:G-protein coupled receptors family 2 profile 2 domain-containing protein [Madurella fahalii]|uniref:G-protein coupled receptors family 2 profile 2 domain-containing protein n=1 Tax=Madurella fahalii TaxID=1157608 RepID=A0ABQ0FYV9_9PEZI